MAEGIRKAFLDQIDQIRDHNPHCAILWSDTNKFEVIPQEYIRLPPAQHPEIEVMYTIIIDGVKRYGIVLATGTREHCESVLHQHQPQKKESDDHLDEFLLMKILGKLLSNLKKDESGDTHDAQCASCHIKPIRNLDRYRCLECSNTSSYDLCSRCFEDRRVTGRHLTGHPMVHFKFPNEFLGIQVNNVDREVNLNQIKQLKSLVNERHNGIQCDGVCGQKNLIGLRFKCDTCFNYDLCEICALEKHVCTKTHQRDHPLILTSEKTLPKIDPNDIELGKKLGEGGFGYVCVARWKSKGREVACKIIKIKEDSQDAKTLERSFLLEVAAYRELSGPYILRTYAYATRINGIESELMMIMELMSRGSLEKVLDKEGKEIPLERKLSMAKEISAGMRKIHQHGMVHRDIRPDNILISEDYVAKIGDLGIARLLDPKSRQTRLGCDPFMPPEYFDISVDGRMIMDSKLDIFTYGLTLNQLFTGIKHKVHFNGGRSKIEITKESPVFYNDIILRCLDNDPKRRPTAIEIETTLDMYQHTFAETMINDAYTKMNTKQKDEVFIEFYLKNHSFIQRFIAKRFSKDISVPIQEKSSDKRVKSPSFDPSRMN